MIVEFFGPPAVGKTTLARALAVELGAVGVPVNLVLSDRPADKAKAGIGHPWLPGALQRILPPAAALAATTREMLTRSADARTVSQALEILPQRGVLHSLRVRQYLLRLLLSWREATRLGCVTLFDQGCAQAVCSLAAHVPDRDLEHLHRLLVLLPAADLLIRVDAPPKRIRAKLRARLDRQGPLERRMEGSVEAGLAFIPIAAEIEAVCHPLGRRVILAGADDERARRDSVLRIAGAIAAMAGVRTTSESVPA